MYHENGSFKRSIQARVCGGITPQRFDDVMDGVHETPCVDLRSAPSFVLPACQDIGIFGCLWPMDLNSLHLIGSQCLPFPNRFPSACQEDGPWLSEFLGVNLRGPTLTRLHGGAILFVRRLYQVGW